MKKKRKVHTSRLIILLLVPVLCLGLVGWGIHSLWDHYEQNKRQEYVAQLKESHDSVQKQIQTMKVSPYIEEETFEAIRELAIQEDHETYDVLNQFENVRIEDDDFETVETLHQPKQMKFYRLMKLAESMKEEGQSYFNFVSLEPESRIDYALQFKNREKYAKAPEHLGVKLDTVPALLQWDTKWGFIPYGDMRISFSGCAPTSLSMVFSYLKQDDTITPARIAKYSEQNGMYVYGVGTSHMLLTQAAKEYGVNVSGVLVQSKDLKKVLNSNQICIASVRPGDFTQVGHFIVITGMKDGKLIVHDPNSKIRTKQLWDVDRVLNQTQAIWAYSV